MVDSRECHLPAKMANVEVKSMDKNGQKSKKISIIGSFSSNSKIPLFL